MKEHLLNLIYLQYYQDKKVNELYQREYVDIGEVNVDILGVVLDIIGYPRDSEYEENLSDEDIYCRDWFYQRLTDIVIETPDYVIPKEKIEEYYNWLCGETLELYKINKLNSNDFIDNIMRR